MTQVLGSKWLNFFSRCCEQKNESFWPKKLGWILIPPVTQLFKSKWQNFFSRSTERKIESFWPKKMFRIMVPHAVTQLLRSKWLNFFSRCTERKNWVILTLKVESPELRRKHLNWKNIYCIGIPTDNGSLVLLQKLSISKIHQNYSYINYILKWFWKWF